MTHNHPTSAAERSSRARNPLGESRAPSGALSEPHTGAQPPALRDRIADLFRCPPGVERLGDATPGEIADAVLPVLPEAAEVRAAALNEAADAVAAMRGYPQLVLPEEIHDLLRRLAAAARPDDTTGAAQAGPGPEDTSPTRWLHVTITNPCVYTANRAALSLRDWLQAEFGDGIAMRITTDAREQDEHTTATATPAQPPAEPTDGAGEPAELRDLPREVRRLVHAADCMCSDWAESSKPRRAELWRDLHQAVDDVWNRQIDGEQPGTDAEGSAR